jgi:hypothetical protein
MNCDLVISIIAAPFYLLVVTYAVVQLFLHVTELFIRRVDWPVNI